MNWSVFSPGVASLTKCIIEDIATWYTGWFLCYHLWPDDLH